jgi:hypothetical protein
MNLRASVPATAWTGILDSLRSLFAVRAKRYRPEKFYMRGPGPKSQTKEVSRSAEALGIKAS